MNKADVPDCSKCAHYKTCSRPCEPVERFLRGCTGITYSESQKLPPQFIDQMDIIVRSESEALKSSWPDPGKSRAEIIRDLFYKDNWTRREIADHLNIRIQDVYNELYRARKRIKKSTRKYVTKRPVRCKDRK